MSLRSRIAVCVLSLSVGTGAFAQTSTMESVSTKKTTKTGTVVSVQGNKVVLHEANGNHEYNVPQGFTVNVAGKEVGVDQLKPGMHVTAVITDQVTTRDVTVTKVVSGKVMTVAPSGFVILDNKGQYKSYNFTDKDGNDIYFTQADGTSVPLRNNVQVGDQMSGTFVTKLPPQVIDKRSVTASAVAPPEPAAAPAAVAAAPPPPPKKMPKTASPLPLVGLLAALVCGNRVEPSRSARPPVVSGGCWPPNRRSGARSAGRTGSGAWSGSPGRWPPCSARAGPPPVALPGRPSAGRWLPFTRQSAPQRRSRPLRRLRRSTGRLRASRYPHRRSRHRPTSTRACGIGVGSAPTPGR